MRGLIVPCTLKINFKVIKFSRVLRVYLNVRLKHLNALASDQKVMSQAQNLKIKIKRKQKTPAKKSQKTHRVFLTTQVLSNPVIGTVYFHIYSTLYTYI